MQIRMQSSSSNVKSVSFLRHQAVSSSLHIHERNGRQHVQEEEEEEEEEEEGEEKTNRI